MRSNEVIHEVASGVPTHNRYSVSGYDDEDDDMMMRKMMMRMMI